MIPDSLTMSPRFTIVLVAFLTLFLCAPTRAQQKFHLKSDKTGRVYGPFELVNSNTVEIGEDTLTIVMPEKPKSPPPARPAAPPSPQPPNQRPPATVSGQASPPPERETAPGLAKKSATARNPKAERAALVAAAPWLLVIDEDNYDLSWNGIAGYLKRSVDKEQFLSQLKTVRKIFGRLVGRVAKRTQFRTGMPSAPDGSYVVIQYETEFAEKKAAVETVIMVLDKDGQWRVSGYDVR